MPGVGILDFRAFFGKKLYAWYRPEVYAGLADGATATSWLDASDNARHCGVTGGAPVVKTKATGNDLNGYPTVLFNGTTDRFGLVDATVPADKPMVFLAVVKNTVADDALIHRIVDFDNTQYGLMLDWTSTNAFANTDPNSAKASPVLGDTTLWHVVSGYLRPAALLVASIASCDGQRAYYTGGASVLTNSSLTIGASVSGTQFWTGSIVEVAVVMDDVSLYQLREAEASLARKFNLTSQYKLNG